MADESDPSWIRSTANELNNLLQVITESGDLLEDLVRGQSEAEKYLGILRASARRAISTIQQLNARGGGAPGVEAEFPPYKLLTDDPAKIIAESLAAPIPFPPPLEIHNPTGHLELVMIVDDEEFITLLAWQALAEAGYRVVTARDGVQALEIYRKLREEIALVILDFTMPVLDGWDVFVELRELNPNANVVLSSGFTEHAKLRAMLARGLRGFIPKPYTQDRLLAHVRQTLDAMKPDHQG